MSNTDDRVLSHGIVDTGDVRHDNVTGKPVGHTPERTTTQVPVPGSGRAGEGLGAQRQTGAPASNTLIDQIKANDFQARWNDLKGQFVDDPQHVVRGADGLVAEVLDELEKVFRTQRGSLGSNAGEGASTEDLRVAFGKYREFFDRLLTM